jgi:hypothetical protein
MRRPPASAGLLLVLAAALPAVAAEQPEYAIKAAFLAKFGVYVEWPPGALGASVPMTLCVVGDDPFGSYIDEAVAGQQIAGRGIVVKRLKTVSRESGCHIAYVGSEPRPGAVSASLRGSPTLVVTDAQTSAVGGAIHFVLRGNRVRFTIDDDAAAQCGLNVSSRLLSLALAVKPRGSR